MRMIINIIKTRLYPDRHDVNWLHQGIL